MLEGHHNTTAMNKALIKVRNGSSRRVTFGPGSDYVAWLRFGGNLCSPYAPTAVQELISSANTMYTTIRIVALGMDDTYIVIWEDGTIRWNLKDHYKVLDKILAKCEGEEVDVSQ